MNPDEVFRGQNAVFILERVQYNCEQKMAIKQDIGRRGAKGRSLQAAAAASFRNSTTVGSQARGEMLGLELAGWGVRKRSNMRTVPAVSTISMA